MYNGTLNLSASATGDKALQKDADALSSIVSALDTFTKLKKGIQEVIATVKDGINLGKTVIQSLESAFKPLAADTAATNENTAAHNHNTDARKANAAATAESAGVQQADTEKRTVNTLAIQLQNAMLTHQTKEELSYIAAKELSIVATGTGTKALAAHTLATGAATVATRLLNAAMTVSPFAFAVAGITAVVAALAILVKHLSKGSEAYQAQKKEVEELASAQEELAQSAQESTDAFENSAARLEASGKVARDLVEEMKDVASTTDDAAAKNEKMAALCAKLNATMDGLNVAYDKENGVIRNVNTGQEVSLEQLDKLVDAKAKLAKTEAWTARQNELLVEQVRIEEELALIEQQREAINADNGLSARERKNLLNDLTAAENEYTALMEESQARLVIVNEKVANSSTESAEQVVSNYERMESAVAKSDESLQQVSEQWGVATDEILDAMEEQGIGLDEWVRGVEENTDTVINDMRELPTEMEYSLDDMITVMNENAEKYDAWRAKMAAVSEKLAPEVLDYLEELGPGTTAILDEIINDTTGTKAAELNAAFEAVGEAATDGMTSGLHRGAEKVYKKTSEIGGNMAKTMRNTLAVKSPSRVMIGIFKNVMLGAIKGMDDMKEKTYATAAGIANGVAEKLTLSPERAGLANARLLALSSTSLAAMPPAQLTYAGSAGSGGGSAAGLLRRAVDILDEYLPEMANMQVVLDTGAAVGGMAPAMDEALGRRARKKARG